jgi:hypothetical protein
MSSPSLAYVHAVNCGEMARLEQLTASTCKNTVPTLGRLPEGPLALQMYWTTLQEAFAPLLLETLDYQSKGQWEWIKLRILGIHSDEFMEFAPTFRYIALEAVWKARASNGKLVETQLEFNPQTLLSQLRVKAAGLPRGRRATHPSSLKPE